MRLCPQLLSGPHHPLLHCAEVEVFLTERSRTQSSITYPGFDYNAALAGPVPFESTCASPSSAATCMQRPPDAPQSREEEEGGSPGMPRTNSMPERVLAADVLCPSLELSRSRWQGSHNSAFFPISRQRPTGQETATSHHSIASPTSLPFASSLVSRASVLSEG